MYFQSTELRLGCLLGHLLESLVRNTDGERPHPDRPAAVLHQLSQSVHAASQAPGAAVNEVDAVVLDVKTNEVTAKDALKDQIVPREYLDHVPGWKWNVQKETDLAKNIFLLCNLPDCRRRKHQMIIVDPNYRNILRVRIACEFLLQSTDCLPGEELIDPPVGDPVGLVKHSLVGHRVKQRPECGVTATVVIQLVILVENKSEFYKMLSVTIYLVCEVDGDHLAAEETSGG